MTDRFRDRSTDWYLEYDRRQRKIVIDRLRQAPDLVAEHRANPRNQREPRRSQDLEDLLSYLGTSPGLSRYFIYQAPDWQQFRIVRLAAREETPSIASDRVFEDLDDAVHEVFLLQLDELRNLPLDRLM